MKTEKTEHGTLEVWTPDEVAEAQKRSEIVLIDVRTPQEYAFERISGALLLAMHDFHVGCLPGQEEKRIVLHCGSGKRSGKVAEMCLEKGISQIAHMDGGMAAWKDAGLDYIGTDMSSGAPEVTHKDA